ncbi:MAG: type II secretion system protein N [Rhodoferax sp.]
MRPAPRSARPAPTRPGHAQAAWRWAGCGAVLGLLASVLVLAPAHWLAAALEQASAGRLRLEQSSGTVWDGSARLVLGAGAGSTDSAAWPSRVQWRLRPVWSGLQLHWSAPCCLQQGWQWTLRGPWSGVAGWELAVQDLDAQHQAQLPSALLSGLGTPWNTLQPEGTLQLRTQGLALRWHQGRWSLSGQAEVQAVDLNTALSTLRPLGSYRVRLDGGETPQLKLHTLSGALRLSGSGSWSQGALQFRGEASAAPEHLDALGNLLNIIGRREGERSLISLG